MTAEQQRITIAEACGWKLVMDDPLYEPYWEDPKGNMIGVGIGSRFPDYLNDLNAMHEAERTMGDPQLWDEYQSYLSDAMRNIGWIYHATAAQRARAFLRTIGKWGVEP